MGNNSGAFDATVVLRSGGSDATCIAISGATTLNEIYVNEVMNVKRV